MNSFGESYNSRPNIRTIVLHFFECNTQMHLWNTNKNMEVKWVNGRSSLDLDAIDLPTNSQRRAKPKNDICNTKCTANSRYIEGTCIFLRYNRVFVVKG